MTTDNGPVETPKRVAESKIGDITISTILLHMNHNLFGDGEPEWFETAIFGGPLDGKQWRYATYEQAKIGHDQAVIETALKVAKVNSEGDKNDQR